jgi:hypothetical protein
MGRLRSRAASRSGPDRNCTCISPLKFRRGRFIGEKPSSVSSDNLILTWISLASPLGYRGSGRSRVPRAGLEPAHLGMPVESHAESELALCPFGHRRPGSRTPAPALREHGRGTTRLHSTMLNRAAIGGNPGGWRPGVPARTSRTTQRPPIVSRGKLSPPPSRSAREPDVGPASWVRAEPIAAGPKPLTRSPPAAGPIAPRSPNPIRGSRAGPGRARRCIACARLACRAPPA